MNDIKIINVYHKDWDSRINIQNNNLLKVSNNEETSNFFINEHFLKITWNNNCIDYFLSCDEINFYQYCEKYYHVFFKNFSHYFIFDNHKTKLFLANHIFNICYDLNNIELYYFFNIHNDEFILHNEENNSNKIYIHFLNKYYEKSYFNQNYKILQINDIEFNNIIISIHDNNFYAELNIKGYYKIYGIYLQLNYLNKCFIYELKNNIYEKINVDQNYQYIEDFDFKKIMNNSKTILFITNNIINNDLIYYLSTHGYNIIFFDNIKNKKYNNIYHNIKIIYYKNNIDIDFIKNEIDNLHKILYYFSNINDFEIQNKINLYSTNLKFKNLIKLIDFNIKFNDTNFNKFLEINNLELLENIEYIKNSNIPKIIHFVWIGDNQFPEQYYLFLNSWIKKYNDFIFCFWNDNNLIKLFNQNIYDKSITYAQKSDIARYEILYHYGGIYVDSDFFSIKNIEKLLENIDFFSGFESKDFIAIGLMGFNKNNEYLKKIILNIELNYYIYNSKNIPNQTGPVYFTNFYNHYVKDFQKYKFFDPNYFYNYSFQNKENKDPIVFNKDTFCYHNWGYSWDLNKYHNKYIFYYLIKQIINNDLKPIDNKNFEMNDNTNLLDLSNYYKEKIFFKHSDVLKSNKKNIIHIMGYFFTGGIEKFIIDINEYGNHNEFNYILLFLNDKRHNIVTKLNNFKCYHFQDNYELINLLKILDPDLILDHYSQYIDYNIYQNNIFQNITIHVMHSAINYNNDISKLKIQKCLHLYKENNMHDSWKQIEMNYYNSLGIKLNNKNELKNIINLKKDLLKKNKYIIIGIVGRIVEEKIPLSFLKKLCELSIKKKNIRIQIYGSQNNILDTNYNNEFDELIEESNIEIYGQFDYNEIYKIYQKINYLLIPSKFETGSYTCLEALSYGIPIIARNNYGLKYIIKNNITGHLLENDDEIIEKIKYLYFDNLINNNSIIYNESLKYNIVDKINNIENIIKNNISEKNLIIITSVLNISKNKLSYIDTRSVFNIEDRFKQTKLTIDSIKKYIPNYFIIFSECSNLDDYPNIEKYIKDNVNIFLNFNDDQHVKKQVDSIYKGSGENKIMLKTIEYIKNNNLVFDNIFKISGRYYLNEKFNFQNYNNNFNQFTLWDYNFKSYCTLFYKIKYKYLNLIQNIFLHIKNDLEKGNALEILFNQYFNSFMRFHNIDILDIHNVSGNLSTEGYFFTI